MSKYINKHNHEQKIITQLSNIARVADLAVLGGDVWKTNYITSEGKFEYAYKQRRKLIIELQIEIQKLQKLLETEL